MTAAQNSTIAPSSSAPAKPLRMSAEQAARVSASAFEGLMEHLGYLDADSAERVRQAYLYADNAHADQWRSSGDPYITHPIAVTAICANWKLDAPALMAALLHDSMEDCGITKDDLNERFGEDVADLVDGLTKLDKLQFNTREENQAESFRKMLLAMARDVRVILIKLADRTHNMRTMSDMPRSKWGRISSETLEIYAPIAHRLGLNQTYRELKTCLSSTCIPGAMPRWKKPSPARARAAVIWCSACRTKSAPPLVHKACRCVYWGVKARCTRYTCAC